MTNQTNPTCAMVLVPCETLLRVLDDAASISQIDRQALHAILDSEQPPAVGEIDTYYGATGFLMVKHADHLAHVAHLQAEIERLKGLQPSFPPRPPEGSGLPRYGLRWNGPQQPLAVQMDDGYWTPWHLAVQVGGSHG